MAVSKAAWVKLVLGVDPEAAGAPRHGAHAQQPTRQPAMAEAGGQQNQPPAAPPPPTPQAKAGGQQPASAEPLVGGAAPEGFAAPVVPIIIGVLKTLTGELTAEVTIANETGFALTLDPGSLKLESGEYKSKPPASIPANGPPGVFKVHSTPVIDVSGIPIIGPALDAIIPDLNHCEGTIRYFVGDKNTVFSCFYINPRNLTDPLGTNDAKASVAGGNASGLEATADKTHGSNGTYTFVLKGGGGPQPTPGNDGGVAASCRVSVVNQTQQTVYLRKQDKAAGDYVTNPATSIPPGGKTDFVFAETPNSKDHGCRGLMTWEVGDPKQAKWDLMWDNQKGAKNLSASFLDPKDGAFHTLDQIDQGDENVPVTFTLSGGGGAGPVVPTGKPTSSVVTLVNASDVPLTLLTQTAHAGKFTKAPPATIAPGANAEVGFAGPDDPKQTEMGSLEWQVGEAKGSTWSMYWVNPRGGDNDGSSTLEPATGDLSTTSDVGEGDQDVSFLFMLSGKAGPSPSAEPTSCAIMVTNQTTSALTLAGQDAAQGAFKKAPPKTIAAGGSALVTFVGPKDAPAQGAKGSMTWHVGEPPASTWTLEWENPPGSPNTATDRLDPAVQGLSSTSSVEQGDDDVAFTYTLAGDAPQPGQKTSCAITVRNDTGVPLTLKQKTAENGSFDGAPPGSIPPGGTAQIAFKGSDGPKPGAAGSMLWQVGDDAAATCSMHWDNPPGAGNTAEIALDPDDKSMTTSATAGDGDEDVPFTFEVGGGGPAPAKDDDFLAPPKSKQPTLRKGDESPDGWVEYAQGLLNHYGAKLTVDGKFDGAMEKAVREFQQGNHCQNDGVIGNETWSVLRKGPKENVGTDGRTPHSFEQKDAQARFATEDAQYAGYYPKEDLMYFALVSPGEQPIDKYNITVKVTQPDKTSHTHKTPIGSTIRPSPDGQGNVYEINLDKFRSRFGLGKDVDPVTCVVDAYLDAEIGGDRWTGNPVAKG